MMGCFAGSWLGFEPVRDDTVRSSDGTERARISTPSSRQKRSCVRTSGRCAGSPTRSPKRSWSLIPTAFRCTRIERHSTTQASRWPTSSARTFARDSSTQRIWNGCAISARRPWPRVSRLNSKPLGLDQGLLVVSTRYKPFHDEQGRLVSWYATGTDIDDRKRAEDRTRNENVAFCERRSCARRCSKRSWALRMRCGRCWRKSRKRRRPTRRS